MPNLYPRRFSNPETLRKIRIDLLLAWLNPAAAYLEGRGLKLPEMKSEECRVQNGQRPEVGGQTPEAWIDYDKLGQIFMESTPDMPTALVDSIFLIHGMASLEGMEILTKGAEAHGLEMGFSDEMTPADVAVKMWLLNPQLLEHLYNSRELVRPRSFRYFSTNADPLPAFIGPSTEQIVALEEKLNGFYMAWRRGKGARVFCHQAGPEWCFLIRHGGTCRREGAMENGEPTSVFFRPQKYDLLKYESGRGEMAVNCCSDLERRVLLRLFGGCLFGRKDFFPGTAKYTLAPLLHGRACLACGDIPGIESVNLIEVEFCTRKGPRNVLIRKADDIFHLIEEGYLAWPKNVEEITRATFLIKFWKAKRARRLTIVPCNKALYGRDSDSGISEKWLKARTFISDCVEDEALSEERMLGKN